MVKRIKPIFRVVKIEAEINKMMGLDESWIPYIDISERENDVTVRVEIPGVEQRDVAIMLHNSRIEIKGMKKENLPRGKLNIISWKENTVPSDALSFCQVQLFLKKHRLHWRMES
jgi:HSP20 family molecular chaperone IbpA